MQGPGLHVNSAHPTQVRGRSGGRWLVQGAVNPGATGSLDLGSLQAPGPVTAAFVQLLQQHPPSRLHPVGNGAPTKTGPSSALKVHHLKLHHLQHTSQLLQDAAVLAPQLQPHQASLILYVCAKCRLLCTQQLLHGLMQQLLPSQLHQLPPAGLVNAAWALAVLHTDPGAAWMDAFYAVVGSSLVSGRAAQHPADSTQGGVTASSTGSAVERLNIGINGSCSGGRRDASIAAVFNRHQLVQLLWAVAVLKQQPPAAWLQDLLSALQPQLQLLGATEITNVIWALAQIGFRPGRLWLGAWFLASRRALPTCNPDTLACQAASLGVLRVTLGNGSWLVAFRAATVQQLHSLLPQHIGSIFCGLAKRRSPAPPHWVRLLLLQQLQLTEAGVGGRRYSTRATSEEASDVSARNLAATVWSLPLLLYPTAVDWAAQQDNAALLKRLAAASLPLLAQCSVGQLVQLATGFARLGFYPGAHWLKSHENAVAQHKLSLTDVNRLRLQVAARQLWKDG